MGYTPQEAALTIGDALLQNKKIKKGVETTLTGTAGLGAIGIGTAMETVGAGTIIGTAGMPLQVQDVQQHKH